MSSEELSGGGALVRSGWAVIATLRGVRRRAEDSKVEGEVRGNREWVEDGGVRGLCDVVATDDFDERSERVSDVIGRVLSRGRVGAEGEGGRRREVDE